MRRLQGWHNAFRTTALMESLQGLIIGNADILSTTRILQPGMFGPYARVIQPRGDGMGGTNLAVLILDYIGAVAVQYTNIAGIQCSGVLARTPATPRGFHTNQLYRRIVNIRIKNTHGV